MNPGSGHDRDEWLMAEVTQGRAEALEILVRRYGTLLLTFICRMVHDRQRSEDLFQDVFLIVWKKRRQYRFPHPFRSWLYRIAINRVRQVLRRRGERRIRLMNDSNLIEPSSGGASPAEAAIAIESSTLVQDAVALLPAKQQLVVTMRIWNRLSYAEIADAMGVREATVRSNMHDALATIRRYLEPRM
jgi:RNA polymerase sigma-70 factor (ECF subfamily)